MYIGVVSFVMLARKQVEMDIQLLTVAILVEFIAGFHKQGVTLIFGPSGLGSYSNYSFDAIGRSDSIHEQIEHTTSFTV